MAGSCCISMKSSRLNDVRDLLVNDRPSSGLCESAATRSPCHHLHDNEDEKLPWITMRKESCSTL